MKQQDRKRPQSLEDERNAILERMQASRERYRRMLNGEEDLALTAEAGAQALQPQSAREQRSRTGEHASLQDTHMEPLAVASHLGHYQDPRQLAHFSAARRSFPRSKAVRWAMDHPLLCAAAVAAIVVIGPRKMVRAATGKTTRSAASKLRNLANIDLLTRVLTMVADIAQRNMSRPPRP
jgi:hypothetical protein